MNLGQAVALCLYELARDPKAVHAQPRRAIKPASAAETEQITALAARGAARRAVTSTR